ncbi:hypothetical protein NLG97_g9134 [Lecanicillium saksenae]|uniref:Uncharacterized protein n=1 Tax=Lecanicillium saksenae TaxID=468837 RepID=A0ACC1QIC0_9HYPO|nr:hypothetical protein NLG97_g9134 [Lecanicillium saksenae]
MPSKTRTSRLADLPVELLVRIATFLPTISDLSRLSRTNNRIRSVLEYELFRRDVLECGALCTTALYWAVAADEGHIEYRLRAAEKSIKAGANINAPVEINDEQSDVAFSPAIFITLLERTAASDSNVELAKLLVNAGADLASELYPGSSALSWAIQLNKLEMVKFFPLQSETKAPTRAIGGRYTLLGQAVQGSTLDIVKCLLPHIDPNERDTEGRTALQLAVHKQRPEMVSLLLSQATLDPNAVKPSDPINDPLMEDFSPIIPVTESTQGVAGFVAASTAFTLACGGGSSEIVKLLHDDDRVDVDFTRNGLNAAMENALRKHQEANVEFMIRSQKSQTARLHMFSLACRFGDVGLAKKVLRWANQHDKERVEHYLGLATMVCSEESEHIHELVCRVLT